MKKIGLSLLMFICGFLFFAGEVQSEQEKEILLYITV